jgi:hypothetical protein
MKTYQLQSMFLALSFAFNLTCGLALANSPASDTKPKSNNCKFKLKPLSGTWDSGRKSQSINKSSDENYSTVNDRPVLKTEQAAPLKFKEAVFNKQNSNRQALQGNTQKVLLETGISVNVPKTPEDVAKYLAKMRIIIDNYDRVVAGTLMGSTGLNVDAGSINVSKDRTQLLVSQICSIVPPAELKAEHNQLASTLLTVGNFLATGADGSFASLMAAPKVMADVHNTMENYHSGVKDVIAAYGLNAQLDPFAGESPEMKEKFANSVDQFKTNKFNSLQNQFAKNQATSGSTSTNAGTSTFFSPSLGASSFSSNSNGFSSGGLGLNSSDSSSSGLTSLFNNLTGGNSGNLNQLGNIITPEKMQELGKIMQDLGNQ